MTEELTTGKDSYCTRPPVAEQLPEVVFALRFEAAHEPWRRERWESEVREMASDGVVVELKPSVNIMGVPVLILGSDEDKEKLLTLFAELGAT